MNLERVRDEANKAFFLSTCNSYFKKGERHKAEQWTRCGVTVEAVKALWGHGGEGQEEPIPFDGLGPGVRSWWIVFPQWRPAGSWKLVLASD